MGSFKQMVQTLSLLTLTVGLLSALPIWADDDTSSPVNQLQLPPVDRPSEEDAATPNTKPLLSPIKVPDSLDFSKGQDMRTSFDGRALSGADFSDAILTDSSFRKAKLMNANFTHATLIGVHFQHANASGADFSGADLRNAHLKGTHLNTAKYDKFTTFPEGFTPQAHGMIYLP